MYLPKSADILNWPEGDTRVTAMRVAARYLEHHPRVRVASRRVALEFPNEKAFREYLKEHPNADKSKHTVAKPHDDEGHDEEKPKTSWKDRLKSLSDKARSFVKEAPKNVKKFIENPEFRRKALLDAHKTLTESPEKIAKRVAKTVKDEVHEWKEAGEGIKSVLSGKKMSKAQKKAVKTVAFHVALTAAATVLTTTGGPLVAAGAFGKSMAKHIAMKTASNALGHVHILEEFGHVGYGVAHLVQKLAAKNDHEMALVNLSLAALAKELEKLDDDETIVAALEGMEDD